MLGEIRLRDITGNCMHVESIFIEKKKEHSANCVTTNECRRRCETTREGDLFFFFQHESRSN